MNIFTLAFSSLKFRSISNLFNALILALGVAMIIALLQLSAQLEQRFTRDLQGIDLVVGAKGSPIQLILSSVFHLDIPNGNIPLKEAEELQKNPQTNTLIKTAIPIALGDNYNGFRILGTNTDYIKNYGGELASGNLFTAQMQAVVGSSVAEKNSLKIEDSIVGAHGLLNSNDLHSDFPYKIVGILQPTGSVLDRLVLTPIESVWHVHEHPDADDEDEVAYKKEHPEKEITALLISYKSPMSAVSLPRLVNKTSSMQAASPAFEMARLVGMLGVGTDTIKIFAGVLVAIAAFGFFITSFNAVNDRKYDLALMRSLGATRKKLFALVITEGLMLGSFGTLFGVLLGHILTHLANSYAEQTRHLPLPSSGISQYEICVVVSALVISFLAAIIPAIMAYRVNVAKILAKGV